MKTILVAAFLFGLGGLAQADTGLAVVTGTAPGSAISGKLSLQDTPKGLRVTGTLSGVPAGQHGLHIHEFGSCEDSAKAAGGHFNPKGSPHGFLPKDGLRHAHGGDMGNLTAGADGSAPVDLLLPKISLAKKNPVAGRAVIVHEKADDFSQPVGNAGGRIACGAIVLTGK